MLSLEEIVKRTKEMERAGTLPVFAGQTPTVQIERGGVSVCTSLGVRCGGGDGGTVKLYKCDKKGGTTSLFVRCSKADHHCETCGADSRKANPPASKYMATPGGITVPAAPAPAAGLPPIGKRHLAFHVLPVSGNGVWRRAIDQLRLRWHLFDGAKVFAVATGDSVREQIDSHETDPTEARTLPVESFGAVRAYLPEDAEAFEVGNRADLWESVSWPELFGRVLSAAGPQDAVFYGHAKGVSRRLTSTVHLWAEMLFRLNLDHWGEVETLLRRHPIVGSLTRQGQLFPPPNTGSKWHYSGNFWWARAAALRVALAARPVPADRWGAEAWPGIAFPANVAGTFFTGASDFFLYNPADLSRVSSELSLFLSSRKPSFSSPPKTQDSPKRAGKREEGRPLLSVVVPTTGRDTLGRTLDSIRPQLLPGDQLIVESDATGDWGATPRTKGMAAAAGDYLLFMDDDDVYLPGSLDAVRSALRENPGRPHLFSMWRDANYGDQLPRAEVVQMGNVSTQMAVFPNDPAKLGAWGTRYEGDYDFIRSTLDKYPPGAVVFRPEVIACLRPDHEANAPPKWWHHEPGTYDVFAWLECVHRDDYRLRSTELVGQVCVDVGAHVGSFAYAAKSRGALVVHCYEPQPESFAHLERNAARMPGVVAFREAVAAPGKDMGQPGRPTPTRYDSVTLDAAVERAAAVSPSGKVRVLKTDSEGAEWAALRGFTQWDLVESVVGEWHDIGGMGPGDAERAMSELFAGAGWEVEFGGPNDTIGLFFARPRRSN